MVDDDDRLMDQLSHSLNKYIYEYDDNYMSVGKEHIMYV
jgi:hypothetical protein